MGLLKAIGGATGGVLADQWREYFYCDALDANTLAAKGQKRVSENRSSNTKATENVITNGAVIAVNEGQAMMIIDQGKVVEFCAEAGEFTWDSSSQPSIFYGGLGKGVGESLKQIGRRFGFGGDAGTDQRVYFFNLKEIFGNKYGTSSPIPFRVVDQNTGLDLDAGVRCNGEYSYKIVDPGLFFGNVCGNIEDNFTRDKIDSQMKSELLTALQPCFAKISAMGIRYSAVPAHTDEICNLLNEELSEKWTQLRGIKIISFACNSITLTEEDAATIKEMQKAAALGNNPNMARGFMTESTGEAMKGAAVNENGAMAGFMGMGMAQGAVGNGIAGMYGNNSPQGAPNNNYNVSNDGGFGVANNTQTEWICECGAKNTGKFCQECGKPKPQAGITCSKCGWTAPAGQNPPKFCQECGTKLI